LRRQISRQLDARAPVNLFSPGRSCRTGGSPDYVALSVSVVIVAFDSGASLERCLRSLCDGEPDAELIVVDNGGSDRAVAEQFGVRLVEPSGNLGFAGGCNRGATKATGEVLVFLNPDTLVDPGALTRLAETLQDPSIGIAMARLRLLDRPELLNSGGTVLHLSGLAWAGRYGEKAEELQELEDIAAPSGAAMAIRADLFHELGGFTDELFMYLEDTELGWRAHLYGLRVVVDPGADVYHDYEFGRHPAKIALLERNREIFVLTAYSLRLLLLLAPVLAAAELGMLGVAARQRWFRGKLGGWWWCLGHLAWIARHRRETQRLRSVPDRELAGFLTPVFDPSMVLLPRPVVAANRVTSRYWSLVRKAL
jgi:GT2 family glycosyltransferase